MVEVEEGWGGEKERRRVENSESEEGKERHSERKTKIEKERIS